MASSTTRRPPAARKPGATRTVTKPAKRTVTTASRRPAVPAKPARPRARQVDPALERTRRAFARRQRARRWLTWRRVLVGVLVAGLVGFGVYAVYFSAWLRTEGVAVSGTSLLTREQVLTAASVPTGGPLARVDLGAVQRRVEAMAAVKQVDVTRQWPHRVRIVVTERTPLAVVDLGGRRLAMDAAGTVFSAPASARQGLPVMRVGAGADRDALEEGASVIAALPADIARMVDYVEVRTVDEITLHLRDRRLVEWGGADRSADKARVLLALLQRDADVYDVSVPGSPTTR